MGDTAYGSWTSREVGEYIDRERRALTANFIIVTTAPEYVLIRDIGPWTHRPTVTNDAEGVVRRLVRSGFLNAGRRLFYFDSENCLDEIIVKNGEFAGFMVLK